MPPFFHAPRRPLEGPKSSRFDLGSALGYRVIPSSDPASDCSPLPRIVYKPEIIEGLSPSKGHLHGHNTADNLEMDQTVMSHNLNSGREDALDGNGKSSQVLSGNRLQTQQNKIIEQGAQANLSQDDDSSTRYTPPLPVATLPRPASGMSDPANSAHQAAHGDYRSATGEVSNGRNHVVIKVGMVGDAQIGKTSLMVKYVEGSWDEDYIQTLGVNFMEKTISIRNTEITFSIWDLGGQREFVNMLPLVCNDAVAILFMFDLTRKSTLNSIKEWYRQGRGFNKTAIPILVGTKYDHFVNFPLQDQEEISNQVS